MLNLNKVCESTFKTDIIIFGRPKKAHSKHKQLGMGGVLLVPEANSAFFIVVLGSVSTIYIVLYSRNLQGLYGFPPLKITEQ